MQFTASIRSLHQLSITIRDARLSQSMTQSELAKKTHLTRSWVNQFEQGKIPNASIQRILTICDALHIAITCKYTVVDKSATATTEKHTSTKHLQTQNKASLNDLQLKPNAIAKAMDLDQPDPKKRHPIPAELSETQEFGNKGTDTVSQMAPLSQQRDALSKIQDLLNSLGTENIAKYQQTLREIAQRSQGVYDDKD